MKLILLNRKALYKNAKGRFIFEAVYFSLPAISSYPHLSLPQASVRMCMC
ncbi:hypothetical protein EZS27_013361 [termite gut metagenome]|uniref:Uncharacterized protein n=1 Tax=termite gut metagenome TaxID=433724 RepID=A0A5J4RXH0_9ZZZZ